LAHPFFVGLGDSKGRC